MKMGIIKSVLIKAFTFNKINRKKNFFLYNIILYFTELFCFYYFPSFKVGFFFWKGKNKILALADVMKHIFV